VCFVVGFFFTTGDTICEGIDYWRQGTVGLPPYNF
jgi:hypothetical protein